MHVNIRLKPSVALFSFSFMLLASPAYSAGFALTGNSASGMGNAYAGASASAEDSSTVWFNPAGMSYLGKNLNGKSLVSIAGHIVSAQTKYSDRGSSYPIGNLSGKTNVKSRVTSFIPNLYIVKPINEKVHFGLGINSPFGSKTSYDRDWVGRYQATATELLTVNVNPSLAYKVNDKFSVGGGINVQYVNLKELSSALDSAAACFRVGQQFAAATNSGAVSANCAAAYPVPASAENDSQVKVKGDGVSFGFNVGLLFQPTELTRIGVSYRSKVKHDVEGEVEFDLNNQLSGAIAPAGPTAAASFQNRDIKSTVTLPDSLSVSVAHKVNKKLELLGDVTWTGWSAFDELLIKETDGTKFTRVDENWDDVFRFSLGANYKYNDKLTLRTGVAFDEEPIPSARYRTARIPGNDRTWLSFGAAYKVNKKLSLDVGYAHLFLEDTPVDNIDENGYKLRGEYDSGVDILSAQLNYKF